MKVTVLWDVTSCGLVYRYQGLGTTCCFRLEGTLTSRPSNNKSPLFCKKGTTSKRSILHEKPKTGFKKTFLFIADELFDLSK
jgi:hypothetical protein